MEVTIKDKPEYNLNFGSLGYGIYESDQGLIVAVSQDRRKTIINGNANEFGYEFIGTAQKFRKIKEIVIRDDYF